MALLKTDKDFIAILLEYTNFTKILSLVLVIELIEHTRINNHIIKLINSKQLLYKPIYNLKLVELKTLETYIKANLVNGFIRLFKFLADALILFA